MDNSEYEQLQRDLDTYRATKEAASEKVLGILSAGKALAHKTITHELKVIDSTPLRMLLRKLKTDL